MSGEGGFRGWLLHELRKTALAVVYLLFGLNLLALMFVLLAPGSRSALELFWRATFMALVIGKVVVVSDGVFSRFASGRGTFLGNVLMRSVTYTLVVIAALAAEEVVHGVVADGLSWSRAVEHLVIAGDGGRRFLARFAYLMVMFGAYAVLFELDRYFVGTSISDVILSRYRKVTTSEQTVMHIGLAEPLPASDLVLRARLVRELYESISGLVRARRGQLETYRGRAGLVLWPATVSLNVCRALFDDVAAHLEAHAQEHERDFGRRLVLRAGVARGPVQTLEVTSGDAREIIRVGPPIDAAEALFESAKPGEIAFDPRIAQDQTSAAERVVPVHSSTTGSAQSPGPR